MSLHKDINSLIVKNWKCSFEDIAKIVGVPVEDVRIRYHNLELPPKKRKSISSQIEDDVLLVRLSEQKVVAEKKYKAVLRELERVRKERDIALGIKVEPYEIKNVSVGSSEAVAFMVGSDWHMESDIKPETVNNKNEHNPELGKAKAERFFRNGVKLIKICGRNVEIKEAVIALLGDFINNNIHEELMEANKMSPVDAIIFTENIIISGLNYILDRTDLKVTVVCHSGNHARITKERRISTEAGNSLEYLMYTHIKKYFDLKGDKRIEIIISRGYHSYLNIFDKYLIRFHHGHDIRYSGGIGGIFIPAYKAIAQWNKIEHAYLDVFGHFHQKKDGGIFISNGSLCGYDPYALSIKADYEPPKQTFFLIDKKRGKTIVAPIFLKD